MFKWISVLACAVILIMSTTASVMAASKTYTLADGETISDPTKPANWRAKKHAGGAKTIYKLNYILNADERKQAIVNGKKVTVGDSVSGAKVLTISNSEVVLLVDGRKQSLRVNKKREGIKSVKN